MADEIELIDFLWERQKASFSVGEEIIEERKQQVLADKVELDKIYSWLQKKELFMKKTLSKKNSLSKIVNKEEGITFINKEEVNNGEIATQILKAYFLTEKILENLGLIHHVNYTFTYIDSQNNYYRASNLNLLANSDAYYLEEREGVYALRLRESAVSAMIKGDNLNKSTDLINEHYQFFSRPYWDYDRNNKTGWKVNKGVVAEAFERHWEQLRHSIDQSSFDNSENGDDLKSVGYRWVLYRLSSGSDPYYTGPDTALSQVKNANASIVSNVDTVLNTIMLIKTLMESKVSKGEVEKIDQNLDKLFNQSSEKLTISRKIWDGINDTVKQEIIAALKGTGVKIKSKQVVITR